MIGSVVLREHKINKNNVKKDNPKLKQREFKSERKMIQK